MLTVKISRMRMRENDAPKSPRIRGSDTSQIYVDGEDGKARPLGDASMSLATYKRTLLYSLQ
jgi:hypothetical protein